MTVAILLSVLVLLLAVLLLFILSVLFLPLDLLGRVDSDLRPDDFDADLQGSVRWRLKLRFGWGIVQALLHGQGLAASPAEVRIAGAHLRRRNPRMAEAKARQTQRRRGGFDLDLIQAWVQEGVRLLRRIWRDPGWRVTGEAIYGLGDPASTGSCAVLLGLTGHPPEVRIEPDWLTTRLEGWMEVQGRIYGVEIAAALLASLRNPVLRRHFGAAVITRLFSTKKPTGGNVS